MAVSKMIRNFPVPYPGECLYSLFSRYHVRSGNASFQNTAEDLFGNPMYEFHSSVTTPYRLEFVKRWYPQDTEAFAKQLLLYHTAFQYYNLFCWPKRRKEYYDAFCQAEPANYKPAAHMAREIGFAFHHLRYCPECAREEIELYGEPYWSVIAQIDGVDFCPVHGCCLCDSSVCVEDTHKKLKPASQVLTKRRLARELPVYPCTELDQECLAFSRDVYWLLNHGASLYYNSIHDLLVSNLHSGSRFWHYGSLTSATERLIIQHASAGLLEKMKVLYRSKYKFNRRSQPNDYYFYAYFLPIKVLAIHYLSGSAENFGKAVLKNSTSIIEY
ncbi:MAG: TniQ family protein [Lachnospiraceae bacterium]|nr:TniQ family protein [Lachnospiraceae bacterium]